MRKLFGYILSPLFYIGFGVSLLIFHPLQWLALKIGYSAHKKVVDTLNFFLHYCQLFLFNSVSFKQNDSLPLGVPIVFVANHQSMYDIPAMIWHLRKYSPKFISKIELTKGIPSISINLKYGGGANIDRKDGKQAIMEIAGLGKRMKENNWGAVIFPEGTRAKDGKVKTFQVGGIATLLKRCPHALIVPVAIENSWKIVRSGTYPLNTGLSLKWTVLNPIDTAEKPLETVVLEAEQAIKSHLGQA